ncbi:MAG: ribosome hibernation-promoting factor, HPF/YfiA family [Alphaproteobacteria bacterium]
MQITITGKQIDVGEALRGHVQARLGNGVSKYFDHAIDGHVAFSHEGSLYRTHIQVRVGKGLAWESHADHADIHSSFSAAVEHLEKQLRRHKRKLRGHHKVGDDAAVEGEA